jgi:hypothetical protein
LSIVGAVCFYFTLQSPSWIGFLLHYAGIAMFLLGGIAALAAGWFGWELYRLAAWPTALLVILIYGCFDTYQVSSTSEQKSTSVFRSEEGAILSITRTNEIKRFTGRRFFCREARVDRVAGRPSAESSRRGR